MPHLADFIHLQRRYTRAINLERDLEMADRVNGYVPTAKALDALERFFNAFLNPAASRAWTLTGVYGTGKSAYAHFLSTLCASEALTIREEALQIAKLAFRQAQDTAFQTDNQGLVQFQKQFPQKGLVRAVVTAQREPISHTLLRGVAQGVHLFWKKGKKPRFAKEMETLQKQVDQNQSINNQAVLSLLKKVAYASKTGVLLIIDELGKNLEYAALHQEDLYLLQQIAELSFDPQSPKIWMFCLLHQSFTDYGHRLTSEQKMEWAKIQGRFEDIAFSESSEQLFKLIGHAIAHSNQNTALQNKIRSWAETWKKALSQETFFENLSVEQIAAIYPLHPFTAIALPELCKRYAQNDRSLFTFLTSEEPYSLHSFLQTTAVSLEDNQPLPVLKLDRLYDYFIESAGIARAPQFQRWLEIQGRISETYSLEPEARQTLKTIGILNLVSAPKASKAAVLQAIGNVPEEKKASLKSMLQKLQDLSFVTWRAQLDEFRIWEGSDFDINVAIREQRGLLKKSSLARLLEEYCPLSPKVAQRHSYQTGTLRYFERHYFDQINSLEKASCRNPNSDGILGYWVGDPNVASPFRQAQGTAFPSETQEGKPILVLSAQNTNPLQQACHEWVALKQIEKLPQLQSDGVARREVRQRMTVAKQHLDQTLAQMFTQGETTCWVKGEKTKLRAGDALSLPKGRSLSFQLSEICERVYDKTPILWNELLNRSKLTTQGIKASRVLIEAMLEHESEEKLGLSGYGPERTMYESLLRKTGIHRNVNNEWELGPPDAQNEILPVWKAIETFCLSATKTPLSLEELYQKLSRPPYGVKQGLIPLVLTTVLLTHPDDIGMYYEGSFIPILRMEHFKLLDNQAKRFSVKYFGIAGLRQEFFKELETIFQPKRNLRQKLRNPTLLSLVQPLIQFMRQLPQYTQNTRHLSPAALELRRAVLEMVEPDQLLFVELPKVCGFPPLPIDEDLQKNDTRKIRKKLLQIVSELHHAYEQLLERCSSLLADTFKITNRAIFRQELRFRANPLQGQCIEPQLKRLIAAAIEEDKEDSQWLESLVMVIVDKPAASWKDEDVLKFEVNLNDLSRRFMHLAVLKAEIDAQNLQGFEARRLSLTDPTGHEIHQMVWIDHNVAAEIEAHAEKILEKLRDNPLQQAIVTKLIEKTFDTDGSASSPSEQQQRNVKQIDRKEKTHG